MVDNAQNPKDSDDQAPEPPGSERSISWVIPLITTVFVVLVVVMGLIFFNHQVPIDTIPETPEELPDPERAYRQQCGSCHGASGQGAPGRIPPLVGTERVVERDEELVLIVLHGMIGPLEVRGETYDSYMPPMSHRLSDPEIASILTYLRQSFGNDAPPIDADTVADLRIRYPQPHDPWTVEALEQRRP